MIQKVLTYYANVLDEYLAPRHSQPEGMAMVGLIGKEERCPNKIVVSLVNLERETAGGMVGPVRQADGHYIHTAPPLLLNLHILLAAVYDEKRYAESLSVLSDTLMFIQSNPQLTIDATHYTMEWVPLSTLDLHNIWTTMGGQYYPSVVCKLRRILISGGEILSSGHVVNEPSVATTH
ncbi:MAG: DUF4255 domain-containing protein [Mediterranea sp.]|jgi:hypothetical protein|nr:DUF4255 domain-containing protein [Mediterranea sp.]